MMNVNRVGGYSSFQTPTSSRPAATETDNTLGRAEADTAPVFEARRNTSLAGRTDRPRLLSEAIIGAPQAGNGSQGKSATLNAKKDVSKELNHALLEFSKKSGLKLFHHRPTELKAAAELLSPLQGKTTFSRREQLVLIDASLMLGKIPPATLAKYPAVTPLIEQIDRFTGSARELSQALSQSAAQLEHDAKVPSFSQFLLEKHPGTIAVVGDENTLQLTQKGRDKYKFLKQDFELTALDRHEIPASGSQLSARDIAVTKLIEGGYQTYQNALRNPNDSISTRRALLECAEVVTQLAKAKPEEVKKDRIATVFPGGVTDPSKLEPGKIYKERGFVFVGGERPSDQGRHMMIKMTKGYAVDARRYYGHSMNNEDKLQWISLPGAQFRFDGVSSGNNKKTYMFSQVSR